MHHFTQVQVYCCSVLIQNTSNQMVNLKLSVILPWRLTADSIVMLAAVSRVFAVGTYTCSSWFLIIIDESNKLCSFSCSAVTMKEVTGLTPLLRFLVSTMWRTHLTFDLRIQHFISLFFMSSLSVSLFCQHTLSVYLYHTQRDIIDHCVTQYQESKHLALPQR